MLPFSQSPELVILFKSLKGNRNDLSDKKEGVAKSIFD